MNWFAKQFRKVFGMPTHVIPVTDEEVVANYVLTGTEFGDVVSMIYLGECIGFENLLASWETAERAYANLGYRTLPVDDFVDAGGYGKELTGLRIPREIDENPVYHAAYYRKTFLNKNVMVSAEPVGTSGAWTGTYVRPTTKHLQRK